jgi:hypothetical protein
MSAFSVIHTRAMLSSFAAAASASRFFVFSTVEWTRHDIWKMANRDKPRHKSVVMETHCRGLVQLPMAA